MSKTKQNIYQIGTPGKTGFGVAAIKDKHMKDVWVKLEGHDVITSPNYGNVYDPKGSVMVWIPAFWFKWTKKNKCKISNRPKDGYALHRAFIDNGKDQRGFFVDKYECGNENGVFQSGKDLKPCSTHGSTSISNLANKPDSDYGGLYKAVKTRGPDHFLTTMFIRNALGMLSFANNGNKLKQMEFHNGQECGVRHIDINRFEIYSGLISLEVGEGIFKVLKQTTRAADLVDDMAAYDDKLYDDLDLSSLVSEDGWKYLDDSVTTFKMSTDLDSKSYVKTCLGLPRVKALSDSANKTYANDGIYRYKRDQMACLCGGSWTGTSNAGVVAVYLGLTRATSSYGVGGRASVYL